MFFWYWAYSAVTRPISGNTKPIAWTRFSIHYILDDGDIKRIQDMIGVVEKYYGPGWIQPLTDASLHLKRRGNRDNFVYTLLEI